MKEKPVTIWKINLCKQDETWRQHSGGEGGRAERDGLLAQAL